MLNLLPTIAAWQRRYDSAARMAVALMAAQETAQAEAQQEISSLKAELQVRAHAEQALQAMLAAQHEQQGQLEDLGAHQQTTNAETFEDLRAECPPSGCSRPRLWCGAGVPGRD